MLITGIPQFETQDDLGAGHGISSIPEWYLNSPVRRHNPSVLEDFITDEAVLNVFIRLRNVFERAQHVPLSTTQLHDLTCFVMHRLLPPKSDPTTSSDSPLTECMRYGIILYMLSIHGTTYYPHTFLLDQILTRLESQLAILDITQLPTYTPSFLWLLTTAMAASTGTEHYQRLSGRARAVAMSLQLSAWKEIIRPVREVLWLESSQYEGLFQPHWDKILC